MGVQTRLPRFAVALGMGLVATLLLMAAISGRQAWAAESVQPTAAGSVLLQPRFPVPPPQPPEMVAAGKALYSANCGFCHGSNARGGESGPNLLRSEVVLDDHHGERIARVVRNGRVDQGMPRFSLSPQQIAQIAAFLHSFPLVSREAAAAVNPVVGDAAAGRVFFNGAGKCIGCHSPAGDLAGIGSRLHPRELQRAMLTGNWQGSGFSAVPNMIPPGTTVTVTEPAGQSYQGRLLSIDEFSVSLRDSSGTERTFQRSGEQPGVQVHNPLAQHQALLRVLTDTQIHDLTAYLVTLK